MARGTAPFKQADVTRALRGAVAAGVEIARVEIVPRNGNIVILTPRDFSTPVAPYDVWKEEKCALKFRGVNTVRKRLADGSDRVYYYHRDTGMRFDGEPGSPEFIAVLRRAESKLTERHPACALV